MITKSQDMVQVRMLHASVYHRPIYDSEGNPQKREVEWFNGKRIVDATEIVYCEPSEHAENFISVPKDVAEFFIAHGHAELPTVTRVVTLSDQIPQKELPVSAPTVSTDKTVANANVATATKVETTTVNPLS